MNFMMLIVIVFVLLMFLGFMALVVLLMGRRDGTVRTVEPVRVNEPMRAERVERISREIEKINAMQAAGRISAEEAADLKAALEGERHEWTAQCADFARQSGTACAQQAKKRLAKSRNIVLAGVCGGLAEWFECDAALVRVVYVLLTLFTSAFPGLILYIVLWIVMPEAETASGISGSPVAAGSRKSGGKGWLILLIVPLAVLLLIILAVAALFCVRSSVRVSHQGNAFTVQQGHESVVQDRLSPEAFASSRTFPEYSPAFHPYEAVFYLPSMMAESGNEKTVIHDRLGIQRYPHHEVVTSLPAGDPNHGCRQWSVCFWSDTSETALRETLTGLCVPPAVKLVSLRTIPIQGN
jgi:phage shock protein C